VREYDTCVLQVAPRGHFRVLPDGARSAPLHGQPETV
jgi:hypothetical protein